MKEKGLRKMKVDASLFFTLGIIGMVIGFILGNFSYIASIFILTLSFITFLVGGNKWHRHLTYPRRGAFYGSILPVALLVIFVSFVNATCKESCLDTLGQTSYELGINGAIIILVILIVFGIVVGALIGEMTRPDKKKK